MIKISEINSKGEILDVGFYSSVLSLKEAFVCFIEQHLKKNFNTWTYDYSKYSFTELKHAGLSYECNDIVYIARSV